MLSTLGLRSGMGCLMFGLKGRGIVAHCLFLIPLLRREIILGGLEINDAEYSAIYSRLLAALVTAAQVIGDWTVRFFDLPNTLLL